MPCANSWYGYPWVRHSGTNFMFDVHEKWMLCWIDRVKIIVSRQNLTVGL